ncbi:MAG: tetratricopeptide repeat protein [Candidatus Hodarchaeales archaeon]|jgi:tetratricopeptide (TPR) repeat protein
MESIEGLAGAYSSISLTYGIMGDLEKEIESLKTSLDFYKQIDSKREIISLLIRLASLMFHYQSENQLGLEYINQSYQLSQEINDESGIAVSLGYLGLFCTWLGELDRGLKFLQRSLLISERIGNSENLAFTLNNIGWNYHNRGELSLALESLNTSLNLSREKQYPWILVWTLSNIGYVNQAQGKFNEACGYYIQSMTFSKEIDDYLALSWGIYQVIKLNIDIKSTEHTMNQIAKLKELSSQYEVHLMHQMYRVAQGMLLKSSPRLKDKAQAQEYFEQIARERIESLEVTADAMINQCELLLFEYKNSENSEVFNDIQSLTNRLLDISEEQNSHSLLSETYLLKAELAVLQEDQLSAREYITKAQTIAEEKGLKKLALAISREHDKLLGQIGRLESLDDLQSESAGTQLEIDQVENLLGRMTTHNLVAVSDATPEEPIMLLIIAEGGMTLFSHTYTSNEYMKGQLIGSFLSAIESFSQEVFSSSIERATLGEHRLVIQNQGELTFSYVFKGESYSALKRLKKFIQILEMNIDLWNALKSKVNTGIMLNTDEEDIIHNILDKIFNRP